jgi:hypothetical protein
MTFCTYIGYVLLLWVLMVAHWLPFVTTYTWEEDLRACAVDQEECPVALDNGTAWVCDGASTWPFDQSESAHFEDSSACHANMENTHTMTGFLLAILLFTIVAAIFIPCAFTSDYGSDHRRTLSAFGLLFWLCMMVVTAVIAIMDVITNLHVGINDECRMVHALPPVYTFRLATAVGLMPMLVGSMCIVSRSPAKDMDHYDRSMRTMAKCMTVLLLLAEVYACGMFHVSVQVRNRVTHC